MSDKKAALVAAKLKGQALEGWVARDEEDGEWFVTFKPLKAKNPVKCPNCKHSHSTSFTSGDDGFYVQESDLKKMGMDVKNERCRHIIFALTPEE